MFKKKFKKFDGQKIDNLIDYIKNKIDSIENSKLVVGTDSQVYQNYTTYAIVICIYDVGNGVHVVYTKENVKQQANTLADRLWGEVTRTVNVADFIRENLYGIKVNTHFDVNPDQKFKSNIIYDAATGYAEGAGFNWEGKPRSWAATCAADRLC